MTSSLLETHWPKLLRHALAALDTLPDKSRWTWGGGTALSIRMDHRLSFDIDIFLQDAADLHLLHPARNETVKNLTGDIQYPGHYLKLLFGEGEVDFISGLLRTAPGYSLEEIEGRRIPLETVEEVLAKKLHFRASKAPARDIFDIEAARRFFPDSLAIAVAAEPDSALRLADMVRRRAKRFNREMPLAVDPTEKGEAVLQMDILDLACEIESLAR